ncbi:MAG: hypothetical protein IJ158_04405 [Treponema sp.]|nr:hypothetical protein [Treponema sp.]
MLERKPLLHKLSIGICTLFGVSIPFTGCINDVYGPAEVYGPPDPTLYEASELYGKVTAKNDGTNLPAIKVTVLLDGKEIASTTTYANGSYYFSLSTGKFTANTTYTIQFEDVDGATNGSYETFSDSVTLESLSVSTRKDAQLVVVQ